MADVWDEELGRLAAERGTTVKVQRRGDSTDGGLGAYTDGYSDRTGLTAVPAIVERLGGRAGEVSQRLGATVDTAIMMPVELDDGTEVDVDPARDQIVGVAPATGPGAIAGRVFTFPRIGGERAGAFVHPIGSVSPSTEGKHLTVYCKEAT